ncbi:MAG: glycosyltransferase family 4 protein [Cyanobacteria bacterium J06629_2]
MKKLLLVTFPVDLGNATFEKRFVDLFQKDPDLDLELFRFVTKQKNPHPKSIFSLSYFKIFFKRLLVSMELWKAIRKARKENRKVLFHGVSTALFGYFATGKNQSYIVTEWTRKLYEPIWKSSGSPGWLTWIHKKILNAQTSVLGLTSSVIEQIAKDYELPKSRLKKVKLPFSGDLSLFKPGASRSDEEVRLLFVGGDFERKGGDVLLNWFKQQERPGLKLTMMTNHPIEDIPGVTKASNIQYGQEKHIEMFGSHDIFVLPTNCDSYPSVLGEAACSGLAIITTKYALGAAEVINEGENGYICDSQAELLKRLDMMIEDKASIKQMKQKSRQLMEQEYAYEEVLKGYVKQVFA